MEKEEVGHLKGAITTSSAELDETAVTRSVRGGEQRLRVIREATTTISDDV